MNPDIEKLYQEIEILQEQDHKLENKIQVLSDKPVVPFQLYRPVTHNDSSAIKTVYEIPVTVNLLGTAAATAGNYGYFFTANKACEVTSTQMVYKTAGNDAGTVTLTIESLTGTTILGSGTALLSSALSLKATAATVYTGTIIPGIGKFLADGNRLALKLSGTPTAVDSLQVTVGIKYI